MKRLLILILCSIFIFAFTACNSAESEKSSVMQAEITQIENGTMLVTLVAGLICAGIGALL